MTASRSDEGDLLRRIAAGEDDAFSAFYREHLDAVVAFFKRRVGDRELQGCDFLHTGEDGLIDEMTVMVRPRSAMLAPNRPKNTSPR